MNKIIVFMLTGVLLCSLSFSELGQESLTGLFSDIETASFPDRATFSGYKNAAAFLSEFLERDLIYSIEEPIRLYEGRIKTGPEDDPGNYAQRLQDALDSYGPGQRFQLSRLGRSDEASVYRLAGSDETIGFIQIAQLKERWYIWIYSPLDQMQLKKELMSVLSLAEEKFKPIQGARTEGMGFGTQRIYNSLQPFYGCDHSTIMLDRVGSARWSSVFLIYPFSALAYQMNEIRLSYPDTIQAEYVKNDGELLYRFHTPEFKLSIHLLQHPNSQNAQLWITRNNYTIEDQRPVFTGSYEGDDLYQLMGRSKDDAAIMTWLNSPEYGFQLNTPCGETLCFHNAPGINLTFSKRRLKQIELFDYGTTPENAFKGKLPKGITLQADAASIDSIPVTWQQDSQYYKEFTENGITTMVYFDHVNRSKITAVRIQYH